ncbi:MAG: endolytic transglycosylase MltG [Lachnospiraceae bacterium]|nr:endolytic transglycosylase MltG [Lachnospiraceae bacterium]
MNSGNLVGAVFGAIFRLGCTVLVIFVIYQGALTCYDYGYRIFMEPAVSSGEGRTVSVTIPKGMSAQEMGELFQKKGLINDANLFVLQYYLSEFRKDIQPGTFDLSTAMTAEEMMEVMATPEETEEEES